MIMFTTLCFIRKNTPKLREKLEKLGYKIALVLCFMVLVGLTQM